MRRVISIFLALTIWIMSSGVGMALHHATADHDHEGHHDESTCLICAALHAALPHAQFKAPDVSLQLHPWTVETASEALHVLTLILTPPCRGPPGC